jgi:galactose mutarotase-like enzyme
MITLRSPFLEVVLDPDRGGEFRSVTAGGSQNLLAWHEWDSPLSVDDGPGYGTTELDWLSRYHAGWQVLFPNSGAESVVDGVPVAFHGEASLARLTVLSVTEDACTLRAVARLPLELTRTVRLSADRAALHLEETVTCVGARPVQFIWGHHPTFPAVAGSRIDLPGSPTVEVEPATTGRLARGSGTWPLLPRADGGIEDLRVVPAEDQVRLSYQTGLTEGWVALRPPVETNGPAIGLAWDLETFPFLWLWLQNADPGFPWYGRARMLGLEPQRSWPFDGLAPAAARGQAMTLQSGQSASSWITLTVFPSSDDAVTGISREGHVTRGRSPF